MKLNCQARGWLVLLFTFSIFIVRADTWTDPDTGYTWTYRISSNSKAAEIYNNYSAAISPKPTDAVTIPATLGGKPVTSIGSSAFSGCSGLTSVTIPDSVTSIGAVAFSGCSGLTSVTIPDSVTSIGDSAFSGCSGLTSVHITDIAKWYDISFDYLANPLYYAHDLYLNGEKVTDLVIPDSVTSIGGYAFSGCSGLTSVTIPDSVTSIGSSAFSGCSGLASVTIPDSVTSIGGSAFRDCSGLAGVTIPDSVTSIGERAFWGCSGLTNISVGAGNATYSSVNGLLLSKDGTTLINGVNGDVTIPDSVTSIGVYAFRDCSGLAGVTIPDTVTSIGRSTFFGCSGLTSVTIPDSVTSIGERAFWGCSGLTNISVGAGNATYSSVNGLLLSKDGTTLINGVNGDVTIPDSVTSIGRYAFSGCSGLTSVTIGNSVAKIIEYHPDTGAYENAFGGCAQLAFFSVDPANAAYKSQNGLLLSRDGKTLVCGVNGDVTIPDSVTSIGEGAFRDCSGLTSVTIPDSVTSIGDGAFYGCSGLTSVTISDSVTSIGDGAFYGCSGLTSVTISDSVTSIGERAFWGCSGLTSVTIPDSVTSIRYCAFYGCSGLTSVTIPDSVTSIHGSAFNECSGITSVTIPSRWALSSIFPQSYSSITNVTIPSGSTGIANSAFEGCAALTSISIPDSVTSIGNKAFYNCTSLERLAIPEGVKSYGADCFEGCPVYMLNLYRAVFGGGVGGGSASVVTTVVQQVSATVVQQVESPYSLTNAVADRAIASVTVDADCAIDGFVLKDGKVYDAVLYISNTADRAVTLTLPSGYVYKAIRGAKPLVIPANSQSILSVTRLAGNVFLVSREDLETIR